MNSTTGGTEEFSCGQNDKLLRFSKCAGIHQKRAERTSQGQRTEAITCGQNDKLLNRMKWRNRNQQIDDCARKNVLRKMKKLAGRYHDSSNFLSSTHHNEVQLSNSAEELKRKFPERLPKVGIDFSLPFGMARC